jgi:hypothetical protein
MAWSVSGFPAYAGGTILERRPWLPFSSYYPNTVYLQPAWPALKPGSSLNNARMQFNMPWGPVSESTRTISPRSFHCLSQPVLVHGHAIQRSSIVHAYCEEQVSGWQLSYWGNAKYLDEALDILGKGRTLPVVTFH